MPKGHSKSVCVDFDGTIFEFAYPAVGPIMPGVVEALTKLREDGWWVVISSCRSKLMWQEIFETDSEDQKVVTPFEKTVQMAEILDYHGVPYDEISMIDKPLAMYYIDDRGIRFGCPHCGPDWETIADDIIHDGLSMGNLSPNEKEALESE